jgi:hypothetical protein
VGTRGALEACETAILTLTAFSSGGSDSASGPEFSLPSILHHDDGGRLPLARRDLASAGHSRSGFRRPADHSRFCWPRQSRPAPPRAPDTATVSYGNSRSALGMSDRIRNSAFQK